MKTSITKWPKIMPVLDSFPFASENHYYFFFILGMQKRSYTDVHNLKVRKPKCRLVSLPKLQTNLAFQVFAYGLYI